MRGCARSERAATRACDRGIGIDGEELFLTEAEAAIAQAEAANARAEAARTRADSAEAEVARLRALLAGRG